MKKATFTKMTDGTQDDYTPIVEAAMVHSENLPDRIIEHLNMLKDDFGGFAVDRYEHCLQTASRAYRDGRDEEYVVCALLHDIGDILAPANHADFAATLLEPYISEKNYWILKHHGIFQGYYFFHFLGLDRHPSQKIAKIVETNNHSIKDILEESLEHELHALGLYKKLLNMVEGASIYLEEYTRDLIGQEEQHQLELRKMLKDFS